MATNTSTATVKGGFWPANSVSSLVSLANARLMQRRHAAGLQDGRSTLALRQIARTLMGVVAGSTATKTYPLIDASTAELGGKRLVVQTNLVNRATTAADVTEINNDLFSMTSRTTFGSTPPINKDQNPLGTR